MERLHGNPALLVRAGGVTCAFALSQVVETMRPLPVTPMANLPNFVLGVALVRGRATPVVDLARFFDGVSSGESCRFVTLRTGERFVAALVDRVAGVSELNARQMAELPPLLSRVRPGVVQAIHELDSELIVLLESAYLLPDNFWQNVDQAEVSR
jgi:purine-binding chemotaxis protein CheW